MKEARAFHARFGQPTATALTPRAEAQVRFRLRLITEEFKEVKAELLRLVAIEKDPKASFGDDAYPALLALAQELADLRYVIEGTAVVFGIDLDSVYAEVHRANMTKTPSPDGGKPTKGPDFTPADVERALGFPIITIPEEETSS